MLFKARVDTWEARILCMSMWSGIVLQIHVLWDRECTACYVVRNPSYIRGSVLFSRRAKCRRKTSQVTWIKHDLLCVTGSPYSVLYPDTPTRRPFVHVAVVNYIYSYGVEGTLISSQFSIFSSAGCHSDRPYTALYVSADRWANGKSQKAFPAVTSQAFVGRRSRYLCYLDYWRSCSTEL